MPGNAGIQIHVECGSTGAPGLDGDEMAIIWISYKFPGEDWKVHTLPLVPRDMKGAGQDGDDAITAANAINNAVAADARAGRATVSTKTKKTPGGTQANPDLNDTTNTWARVEFTGIEEIDAACCHGKVSVTIFGEIRDPPGKAKTPVRISPVEVLLNDKQPKNVKCPGLREPNDPTPPNERKRQATAPPPTTPGDVPWVPLAPPPDPSKPPPVTTPSDPVPPKRPAPPPVPPVPKEGGKEEQRVGIDESLAMGYFRLWCGTGPTDHDLIELTVPWRTLRTSPLDQLQHIAACLMSARIVCSLRGNRLSISHHRDSDMPVVAFEIGTNLAGLDFPWHWTVWLWKERTNRDDPAFLAAPRTTNLRESWTPGEPIRDPGRGGGEPGGQVDVLPPVREPSRPSPQPSSPHNATVPPRQSPPLRIGGAIAPGSRAPQDRP